MVTTVRRRYVRINGNRFRADSGADYSRPVIPVTVERMAIRKISVNMTESLLYLKIPRT